MASRKPIVVPSVAPARKPFTSGLTLSTGSGSTGSSAASSATGARANTTGASPSGAGAASPSIANNPSAIAAAAAAAAAATSGSTAAVREVSRQISNLELAQSRRRLSIMGTDRNDGATLTTLDGDKQFDTTEHIDVIRQTVESPADPLASPVVVTVQQQQQQQAAKPAAGVAAAAPGTAAAAAASSAAAPAQPAERKETLIREYYSLSKVGYVPYNPGKVNQDRACEVVPFGKSRDKAFFGVFDGHGQHGHLVSEFVARNLPKFLMRQKDLDTSPPSALSAAFLNCNGDLATQPRIDCAFSGSTGVAVYITGNKIYCANCGDSRAVIGRRQGSGYVAIPLSTDHKPDRHDEYNRIIAAGGRVEACRGADGVEVGPVRVWLRGQDVPGLAMTRSFGDLVAASVGVIARPEIEDYDHHEDDVMLIMGSDGIWEFITSQEAVEIAAKYSTPEAAAQALLREAEARWREEEEVIDDITVLVAFF